MKKRRRSGECQRLSTITGLDRCGIFHPSLPRLTRHPSHPDAHHARMQVPHTCMPAFRLATPSDRHKNANKDKIIPPSITGLDRCGLFHPGLIRHTRYPTHPHAHHTRTQVPRTHTHAPHLSTPSGRKEKRIKIKLSPPSSSLQPHSSLYLSTSHHSRTPSRHTKEYLRFFKHRETFEDRERTCLPENSG